MNEISSQFQVRLAKSTDDLQAAHRLRYQVFVDELGAQTADQAAKNRREEDRFDSHCDHLIVVDPSRDFGSHVIGVTRLIDTRAASRIGQFYSEDEYDLTPLKNSGKQLLELGRSCIHTEYRDGRALFSLWNGLATYVGAIGAEILFGVASFHGTNLAPHRAALAYLHHSHLAPQNLRVKARADVFEPMDRIEKSALDRRRAVLQTPALIKAYLKLGGWVGEGAYVDHAFNTVDVFMMMDTQLMNQRQKRLYASDPGVSTGAAA